MSSQGYQEQSEGPIKHNTGLPSLVLIFPTIESIHSFHDPSNQNDTIISLALLLDHELISCRSIELCEQHQASWSTAC